jgi:hypothetical protein
VTIYGKKLLPRIINVGTPGSPDIHERIFDAIIHSRLIIADMTVQSQYTDDDNIIRCKPTQMWLMKLALLALGKIPKISF